MVVNALASSPQTPVNSDQVVIDDLLNAARAADHAKRRVSTDR
jgi:hypothetical protein